MKNAPKRIFLQVDDGDCTVDQSLDDWNDLYHGGLTWSEHRINKTDLEFISKDELRRYLATHADMKKHEDLADAYEAATKNLLIKQIFIHFDL